MDWFDNLLESEKESLYKAEIENYSEKMAVNKDGRIIFINKNFASNYGLSPNQLEGKLLNEVFSAENFPKIFDIPDYETHAAKGRVNIFSETYEKQILCRSPLTDENDNLIGYMYYDAIDWISRYKSLYGKISDFIIDLKKSQKKTDDKVIIGNSKEINELKKQVLFASKTDSTVLIEGETGSGKEVVANAIFSNCKRNKEAFIKINCAAIPQELIESELFGYVEGSFTGAIRGGKKGKFELADKGVIMLDEINSLNLTAQAKILRVLEEREIDRIGGEKVIPIDVRVIAISNIPLYELVKKKLFRADLYYRLNVVNIRIPPLRERKSDIREFTKEFIKNLNKSMDKQVEYIDNDVFIYLESYDWPGNVRELRNYIERAMTTCWKNTLTLDNFYWINQSDDGENIITYEENMSLSDIIERVERDVILKTLYNNKGNKVKTAKDLGISRQNLYKKIKLLNINL